MKAQLILLDTPIIVTDGEVKDKELCYAIQSRNVVEFTCLKSIGVSQGAFLKIISTNKPIDYNGIDFGIVDVNKLAMDKLKSKWHHLYTSGYPSKPYPSGFKQELSLFIEGFKASQQLNEKKFSEDDLRNYKKLYQIELDEQANSFRRQDRTSLKDFEILRENTHREVLKQLSLPKTFDIEVEEKENNIKILKKII